MRWRWTARPSGAWRSRAMSGRTWCSWMCPSSASGCGSRGASCDRRP
ncbi:MAG TPA: hypothetical protein DEB06_00415 [Phycisphaerales bacterium]|nr:hypothetical protein [Phycisphaerales bacterium]